MESRFVHSPWRAPSWPLAAGLVLSASSAWAQVPSQATSEELVVIGERVYPVVDTLVPRSLDAVDTAELLRQLPGANLNANGALSGIAQYRGLYGDRVAVSIDGLGTVTGGPNAMDAPLSYASPLMLEHLSLERGIASVSSAVESLGGHVGVDLDRGSFGERSALAFSGDAQARYASNGDMQTTAIRLAGSNDSHKLALLGQRDLSDNLEYPDGRLVPSRLERDRYDLSYGYRQDESEVLAYVGRRETYNTGTASLPMDIRWIETDMVGVRLTTEVRGSALDLAVGRFDVDHAMDNFRLRTPPPTPADFRSTRAVGDGLQWRFGSRTTLENGEWRLGLDGEEAEHTATITNPNAVAFRIENFNAAERRVVGAYAQWNGQHQQIDFEAGLRVNRVQTDSGTVAASFPLTNPMMQMMAANASLLADAFNQSERKQSHTNVDAVFKIGRALGGMRSVYFEIGRKTRAPAYQELYLWLPLESTGGLADGRSYIGNTSLSSEASVEFNLGTNWYWDKAWLTPQVFFKDISDYIQGVPATNATANTIAMMMTGQPALEFANTDAEIYGADLAWGYYLSESLTLDGALTYVRGRRTDVPDNLYRLAPLNTRIALTYNVERWSASVETVAYAKQDKVSAYNAEQRTGGYGIVNLSARWRLGTRWSLSAHIANLLDKRYQDHLDGFNRVAAVDLPLGQRLFGLGRNVQLGAAVAW